MTSSDSAKKGFKTFILTLSISLIVFSVIYYLLTNSTPTSLEVTSSEKKADASATTVASTKAIADTTIAQVEAVAQVSKDTLVKEEKEVKGAKDVKEVKDAKVSVFKQLAQTPVTTKPSEVLAAETVAQTTTSVPSTGTLSITLGLFISLLAFLSALVWLALNPRKVALTGFEKQALKDLDQ